MGLTSYYPIGKTSITDMPQIVEADVLESIRGRFFTIQSVDPTGDEILLPIILHRDDLTPAAFMKNYFQKSNDMYNRSATDTTFIQKCKEFTN